MWSFRPSRLAGLTLAMFFTASAYAQQQAQGFNFERLYSSAPGAGWIVMDTLDIHGGFGGAVEFIPDFEQKPLTVSTSPTRARLPVISSAVLLDFGLAATYRRYRVYANFPLPAHLAGMSGIEGGYAYTAPNINFGSNPDTVGDVRLGFDARILGDARSPFRLGAGAQLYIPNDSRSNYDTDGTFRGMLRLLAAGDDGPFTYAAQTGVHLRPLNDSPVPQSPQGNEWLFGIAGGAKIPVKETQRVVVGVELFGASAFQNVLQSSATDKEWLVSTRYEGTKEAGRQGRLKLGVGRGINPQFGAPRLRIVVGLELFGQD